MTGRFYITTPIYYVNARPHLGHAYTTIAVDTACRFNSMCGKETFFLTGTDEHGDKIERAAKEENLSVRAYVDSISELFRELWPELNIGYDYFIRTTDKFIFMNMRGYTVLDVNNSMPSVNLWTANVPIIRQNPNL